MSIDIKVVRIYISETDQANNNNLMQEIVRHLHDEHRVRGVTVFRGIAGFGAHGQVHSANLLRLHADLPLVIEFFDDPATVDDALEWLSGMVRSGHMATWSARLV